MQIYSTSLPLAPHVTLPMVLALAKRWVVGSPHQPFSDADLPSLEPASGHEALVDGRTVSRVWTGEGPGGGVGLRHRWTDEGGHTWTTEITARADHECPLVLVRLSCALPAPGPRLPLAKAPYVVKLLVREGFLGKDGPLEVTGRPVFLRDHEVERAAGLLRGETTHLPVVYLSTWDGDEPALSPAALAADLVGIAHVVVEPSRDFSMLLRHASGASNAYLGAVGVHWPRSDSHGVRLLPRIFDGPEALADAVVRTVAAGIANAAPRSDLRYASMRLEVLREHLSSSASTESVEDYAAVFDEELQERDRRIEQLTAERDALEATVREERTAVRGVFRSPAERDYLPGERYTALRDAVSSAAEELQATSRRRHVLDSILEANPELSGRSWDQELKACFRGYRRLERNHRRLLGELGFEINEDGKHHKLVWNGDQRYVVVVPKTSSDGRAGKNIAAALIRCIT